MSKDKEAIMRLARQGVSNKAIARQLGVSRNRAAAIRKAAGIPSVPQTAGVDERVRLRTTAPDEEGHVYWTGARTSSGTPRICWNGADTSALRYIFENRTGRPVVGRVEADCGQPDCVAPTHLVDDIERRTVRLLLRSLEGRRAPWDECSACGADWNTEGRVDPDLILYCRACTSARAREKYTRRIEGNM